MDSTSLPPVTQSQAQRMQIIQELGCVACILQARSFGTPAQIHHLLSAGVRISHWHTVGLCCWHHQGQAPFGTTAHLCRQRRGPSLALDPQAFRDQYGDDEELLATQNRILHRYCMHIGMQAHLAKLRLGAE